MAHIARVARWRLSEWRVALDFLGQNRTFRGSRKLCNSKTNNVIYNIDSN